MSKIQKPFLRSAMTLIDSSLLKLSQALRPSLDSAQYRTADGIVTFVRDILRVDGQAGEPNSIAPYQEEILRALVERRRAAVRAPHGAGKSTLAAWIILWVITVFEVDVKAVTTAGAWRQLKEFLWPDVRKWATRADWSKLGIDVRRGKELLDLSLTIGERKAFAAASDNPELIEGAHASV